MARKINSLNELSVILNQKGAEAMRNIQQVIAIQAVKVQSKAKLKFGVYQPAIGDYPAWAALKEETIAEKARAGGGDDPLIGHYPEPKHPRKASKSKNRIGGDLRNSITVDIGVLEAFVGTNDPIAGYHEYGAPKANIPPRPYLRPALFEQQDEIKAAMQDAVAKALSE